MKAFTPLILIALAFASYFMYVKPTYEEIKILQSKKERFVSVLETAKDLTVKRDAILTEYKNIPPEKIERLRKVISEKFNSVIIVNDINSIASKYGVVLKTIKVSDPQSNLTQIATETKDVELKKSTISFNFKGSYEQFVKFIKDIESSLSIMDVTGLSIRGESSVMGSKTQNSAIYDYSVEIKTYSF